MTEPKDKIRVCDLKPGDEIIYCGYEMKVSKVNGVVSLSKADTFGRKYNYFKIGAKSQQWVELIKRNDE